MNPNQRFVGADNDDNWDNEIEVLVLDQMGVGVMNSDYTSEELLGPIESSNDFGGGGLMIVAVRVMVKVIMDRWIMSLGGTSFQCLS